MTDKLVRRVLARFKARTAVWNDGLSSPEAQAKLRLLARAAEASGDKKVAKTAWRLAGFKTLGFLSQAEHRDLDDYFDKYRHLVEHPDEIEKLEQGGGPEARKGQEAKVRKLVKQRQRIWPEWQLVGQVADPQARRDTKEDNPGTWTYNLAVPGFRGVTETRTAPFRKTTWAVYKDGRLVEKGSTKYDLEDGQRYVQAWIEVLRG